MAPHEWVTLRELNPHNYLETPEQAANLIKLQSALNELREVFGKPFIITSGLRSEADQRRIYQGRKYVPMGSAHLKGAAADIADTDGSLDQFCLNNLELLKKLGLYLEDPLRTPRWTHLQCTPPASHNVVFQP